MPINLWEAGGRPTRYDILPTGWTEKVDITDKVYIVTFKAKSPTSAALGVKLDKQELYAMNQALTPVLKEYTLALPSTMTQPLYFRDMTGAANITIEDIKLVEKPLGRATINGIDGFYSGKWTIHTNAKVIDNETIEMNHLNANERNGIAVNVEPGETYTFSFGHDYTAGYLFLIRDATSAGTILYTITSNKATNITAPASGVFWITTSNSATGVFQFKRPMLNLGAIPAPYEPKRGERMVAPVPVKNLFDYTKFVSAAPISQIPNGFRTAVNGYANSGTHPLFMILKPNTTYRFSGKVTLVSGSALGLFGRVSLSDGTTFLHMNNGGALGNITQTFTTPSDLSKYTSFFVYGSSAGGGEIEVTEIQITEGTAFYPYEPYRVQRIKKLFNGIPKKNMHDGQMESGIFDPTTGNKTASSAAIRNVNMVPVKPNTSYVISNDKGYSTAITSHDVNGIFISGSQILSSTITTGPNTGFINFRTFAATNENDLSAKFQVEEGTIPTPYEPYKLQTKRINGVPKGKNLFSIKDLVQTAWAVPALKKDYKLKPNTAYTLSSNVPSMGAGSSNIYFNGTSTPTNGVNEGKPVTMTTDSLGNLFVAIPANPDRTYTQDLINGKYWIQLEEGTTASPYEPLRLGLAPARKGLEFNGNNDRIQANFPAGVLNTLGNKDFTIESKFIINGNNTLATAQQTIFSCGDVRFGVSNLSVNSMGIYTVASGWIDEKPGPIFGKIIKLKAVVKPTKIQVYINDNLVKEADYTGVVNVTQTAAHIATLGGSSYFVNGSIQTLKIVSEGATLMDFDFTKFKRVGNIFKANVGADGVITGDPIQLNRQATR